MAMTEERNGIQKPSPSAAEFTAKMVSPIHTFIAMILWLGSIHFIIFLEFSFLFLPLHLYFPVLGMLVALIFIPIDENSKWGISLARELFTSLQSSPIWSCDNVIPLALHRKPGKYITYKYIYKHVRGYFPFTLYVEDIKAFNTDQAYVFAYEPHSVWPLGAGIVSDLTGFMPIKAKILASSAVFYTPFMRHLWTWMGLAAASRKNFSSLLKSGCSCIVIPGGTQEAFYMNHDSEVAFLKARKGFIRLAMETNSPLVPIFAFGQSYVYNWWKPTGPFFLKLSRALKFTPLIFWGTLWSPIPFRRPIFVVVGKPIYFKENCTPTTDEVSEVHSQFVEALQNLFDTHKARAGYPDLELRIM